MLNENEELQALQQEEGYLNALRTFIIGTIGIISLM